MPLEAANSEYLLVIIVNLGILLFTSWILGIVIFNRQLKDKQALEKELASTQKKLHKQAKDPNYPLSPILKGQEDDDSLDLLHTMDVLNSDLMDKERQLSVLSEMNAKQQALVEALQAQTSEESVSDLLTHQKETEVMLAKLQSELNLSQHRVKELENKLREGQDKNSRIAILEETEKRLRSRLEQVKKGGEQASTLADGLRTANDKNKALIQQNQKLGIDNRKLKDNIHQLANASQEQQETIQKLTTEIDRAAKLERYQRGVINDLKSDLKKEKGKQENSEQIATLEAKLGEITEALERTVREKEFIESHLVEMDKALENAKETEAALDRARKEIETLEMYFPEFTASQEAEKKTSSEDTHEPLPQLSITEEDNPELFNVLQDNRLFGTLQEFWMTLDTPPLQVISQENISRPKSLYHWTKTKLDKIDKDGFFIALGANKSMLDIVAKAMFKHTDQDMRESDLQDAMGELGNMLAGPLANELNPDYIVGISEHMIEKDMNQQLDKVTIAAELLVVANEQPLYIALAKANS